MRSLPGDVGGMGRSAEPRQDRPPAAPSAAGATRGRRFSRGRSRSTSKVAAQPRAWSSPFPSAGLQQALLDLSFVEPVVHGSGKAAVFDANTSKEIEEAWPFAIMGYCVGLKPAYTPLSQFIQRAWRVKGHVDLMMREGEFFVCVFNLEEDMQRVLESFWAYRGHPLILRKWSPDLEMEKERLTSIPVWIRLPSLPLAWWSVRGLSQISSLIGKPLRMDQLTASRKRLQYARVCVLIEAGDSPPKSVTVINHRGLEETIHVQYEWIPRICKHCNLFGHETADCSHGVSSAMVEWRPKDSPSEQDIDGGAARPNSHKPTAAAHPSNFPRKNTGKKKIIVQPTSQTTNAMPSAEELTEISGLPQQPTSPDLPSSFVQEPRLAREVVGDLGSAKPEAALPEKHLAIVGGGPGGCSFSSPRADLVIMAEQACATEKSSLAPVQTESAATCAMAKRRAGSLTSETVPASHTALALPRIEEASASISALAHPRHDEASTSTSETCAPSQVMAHATSNAGCMLSMLSALQAKSIEDHPPSSMLNSSPAHAVTTMHTLINAQAHPSGNNKSSTSAASAFTPTAMKSQVSESQSYLATEIGGSTLASETTLAMAGIKTATLVQSASTNLSVIPPGTAGRKPPKKSVGGLLMLPSFGGTSQGKADFAAPQQSPVDLPQSGLYVAPEVIGGMQHTSFQDQLRQVESKLWLLKVIRYYMRSC